MCFCLPSKHFLFFWCSFVRLLPFLCTSAPLPYVEAVGLTYTLSWFLNTHILALPYQHILPTLVTVIGPGLLIWPKSNQSQTQNMCMYYLHTGWACLKKHSHWGKQGWATRGEMPEDTTTAWNQQCLRLTPGFSVMKGIPLPKLPIFKPFWINFLSLATKIKKPYAQDLPWDRQRTRESDV